MSDKLKKIEKALSDLLALCEQSDNGQWTDNSKARAIFEAAREALED